MSISRKRGSIALARELCVQIAGYTDDDQDQCGHDYGSVDIAEILSAEVVRLQKALAQPEQEPVAFINVEQRKLEWAKYMTWDTPTVVNLPKIPLYTTPPQRTWVGLTEDEAQQTFAKHNCTISTHLAGILARAIEAKLKEKNS